MHVAWAPGVCAARLGEAGWATREVLEGASRKEGDSMCTDEAGAGGTGLTYHGQRKDWAVVRAHAQRA